MSEIQTPVQEVVTDVPAAPVEEVKKEAKEVSPAQDLRDIQNLLIMGIYPGNMAPSVVKAYQMLEAMAKAVESAQK